MANWVFDQSVADVFDSHARQHIPHYDQVIKKTADVCDKLLDKDDPIIDVGCATGNTIALLHSRGYTNLYGLDSSIEMLSKCRQIAHFVNSNKFPFGDMSFQGIICNWTLHFIKNKSEYLKTMVDTLKTDGVLILTDKVSLNPLMIDLYHDFKHSQGVTRSDILAKEESLRDVMFIDGPEWYSRHFNSLGLEYHVIDADYAFMTFLCIKR